MMNRLLHSLMVCAVLLLASCGTPTAVFLGDTETAPAQPTLSELPPEPSAASPDPAADTPDMPPSPAGDEDMFQIVVDTNRDVHPISPLIYGVSNAPTNELQAMGATLNSWGGNPSTRYNWKIGHAWNAGRDWFYRNGNYGLPEGSVSDAFISETLAAGAQVRLALPTLGWVAKNDDNNTCSFPLPDGSCGDGGGSSCENPYQVADPNLANIPVDEDFVIEWVQHIQEQGWDIRFLAMDNEPELWGYTHYDVHPSCTTYDEILSRFLQYAAAVRAAAPEAEITGPVTCCWYFYWNSAAGVGDKLLHGGEDFLPWFLKKVRSHDEQNGVRTLDVLDIHYYPEGLYNANADPETAAHRLRSTRSLWDPDYVDESWINEPVFLIPRMQQLIAEHYPGTRLAISEWNWGAEESMNGALAIADVLGIFGREDLYMAAYWTYPPINSPAYHAFRMYTNFDEQGRRFGDLSVHARSDDQDIVSSYAALDQESGKLYLMLIHKQPDEQIEVSVRLGGYAPQSQAEMFRYAQDYLEGITHSSFDVMDSTLHLTLPPYSITLLVFYPQS